MTKTINKKSVGKKGKVLEGVLVGTVLGVAAGILFAPNSGKKIRKDINKHSINFYKYITPQIKKLKQLGKEQYSVFVVKSLENYAKAKKLSLIEKKKLEIEAKNLWGHIEKHLK